MPRRFQRTPPGPTGGPATVNEATAKPPRKGPWNVLVFPGGTEIANELFLSLRWNKEVQLFSAGVEESSHAPYLFRRHDVLPLVGAPGWLEALKELVHRRRIDVIFPAHDDVVLALARHRAELPCHVMTSEARTCEIARSKRRTYQVLKAQVHVPKVHKQGRKADLPLFAKPDIGQGSQGTMKVTNEMQLDAANQDPAVILCEWLPGAEFTVDCYTDRQGKLVYCAGRERVRTRSGISMATEFVDDPQLIQMAQAINRSIPICGIWFMQAKRDASGNLTLLEFAPRVAGAMALSRASGVNLPLMALYEWAGHTVRLPTTRIQPKLDRSLTNRYLTPIDYDCVYVDLDDALVVRSRLNVPLVAFLVQCVNEGKRIIVITRSQEDPEDVLHRHRVAALADEIIWIRDGSRKSAHIKHPRALLIDDSFVEREDVATVLGLPALDPSAVEGLIDERQ